MSSLLFAGISGFCLYGAVHSADEGHAWLALALGLFAAFDAVAAVARHKEER